MAVKKCSVRNCMSCSSRKEDIGVTYHKYPKDVSLREAWAEVTHIDISSIELTTFVCSRHFRKSDFQIYKDSKYVLKSDSTPSIFPWVTMDTDTDSTRTDEKNTETKTEVSKTETDVAMEINLDDDSKEEVKALNSSKESDGENVDAIRKYIEEQEKQIKLLSSSQNQPSSPQKGNVIKDEEVNKILKVEEEVSVKKEVIEHSESKDETMAVASSVMDMILSESEARIAKKGESVQPKHQLSSSQNGNSSMALSVGSQVEAKDFGEFWYPAEIVEVDYDEMEVLLRYENPSKSKKPDEWISVNSPRLRPRSQNPAEEPPHSSTTEAEPEKPAPVLEAVKEEPKVEEKSKQSFAVGERCLARWRDNRRFIATITKDLGNGNYEIIFDDGFQWKCPTGRLYKYKDNLVIDTGSLTPSTSVPSPIQHGAGPSAPIPPYHTHLFDPNRDYLGSKSERREMKRKLNIKEIFNIGQKKKKKNPEENKTPEPKQPRVNLNRKSMEEKVKLEQNTPKVLTPKKIKAVKKKMNLAPPAETAIKVKNEVPEAVASVASIIGTKKEEEIQPEETVKLEPETAQNKEIDETKLVKVNDEKTNEDVAADVLPELEKKEEINIATYVQDDSTTVEMNTSIVDNKTTIDTETTVVKGEILVDNDTADVEIKTSSAENGVPSEICKSVKTEDTDSVKTENVNGSPSAITEEEMKLEKFEKQDEVKHEEVIDKIKEVITKIEDDLNKVEVESPKVEIKNEIKPAGEIKEKKKLSKIKKGKKLRLLQEKKVKKQVEKVKSELEMMKRQVEEMRKQMMLNSGELEGAGPLQMPESFLLPGEWCCKWVNGQPVGKVCELETEFKDGTKVGLPRRSVQVEDKRLPEGWTKHMVRRSLGHSAGKWDVVLVSPDNRRFHTKTDMRNYLENNPISEALKPFEHALMDFGVHLKLSRRMGWYTTTPGGTDDTPVLTLPAGTLSSTSPLVKRRSLSLKNRPRSIKIKVKEKKRKLTKPRILGGHRSAPLEAAAVASTEGDNYVVVDTFEPAPPSEPPIEDGYVWVGSLKVQIIENLLRCPAEGCFKNFRNNTLIQMHIKHYHRDLRKMLGRTPKVADLAYARTMPTDADILKSKDPELKPIKVKIARLTKREEPKQGLQQELQVETATTPMKEVEIPKQDSPKLRNALINKPVRRPKVLLPVRRPEPVPELEPKVEELEVDEPISEPMELIDIQDFEASISTHTVTKPVGYERSKEIKVMSDDDEWCTMNSDVETQSSFPRSGTPDSKSMEMKYMDQKPMSSESNEDQQKESDTYTFTENGERIKIVHMKREEIINCHCGFREEDGLMVQCELCLCWQHALCHNIQKESEVPEKYTCSICLNPRRGRRSKRFLHDQDRLYEGLLPGARACESLRRSHELSGNLLRIQDALHALTVKYHVATKKDHPKLYLWAKDWENGDINLTQDRLNADYSDLSIMISTIGKENLPVGKPDELHHSMEDDHERLSQPVMLNGLLSSPSGSRSLELPISTAEIERLARSVQEQEIPRGPQPEAAIENGACRERLLRHIQRCQALLDARLDSIEAQVAELESQDPSFEDDETADYFPRTKQTIQMLMRDLDTMEELGAS